MKIKCDICQSEMIDKTREPYIRFVCPNCGNEVVTYDYKKDDLIKFDEQIYEISLLTKDLSIDNLKIVSKLSGFNFLQCRTISNECGVLFSGKAKEIVDKIKKLRKNNISYLIKPQFPYDMD